MATKKTSDPSQYTKPDLREKLKKKVVAGDKGGNPGQWSARKAQLLAHEYEEAGGGYKKPRTGAQKSLKKWGEEKWRTADRKQARRSGGTARYLPDKAWSQLSDKEKETTNKKKQQGSRSGKQFVKNTSAAASARKKAVKKAPTKRTTAKIAREKSAKRSSRATK